MKITIDKNNNAFKPVTVSFTFETQVELDTFGSLLNVGVIVDSLNKFSNNKVEYWKYFESVGANIGSIYPFIDEIIKHPSIKNRMKYNL